MFSGGRMERGTKKDGVGEETLTLEKACNSPEEKKWHWYNSTKFSVTYIPEKLLMLSSEEDDERHKELAGALTEIMG